MRSALFVLLSLLTLNGVCKETTIRGLAPHYIGQSVRVNAYQDYISMVEKSLATTTVLADSTFETTIDLDRTTELVLHFGQSYAVIFADPGRDYQLLVPPPEQSSAPCKVQEEEVGVYIENLRGSDINHLIFDFHDYLDNFMYWTFDIIGSESFSDSLRSFKTVLSLRYDPVDHEYFQNYVIYSVASLDMINHIDIDQEKLQIQRFLLYLEEEPVRYENPMYMKYVQDFFKDYFARLPVTRERKVFKYLATTETDSLDWLLSLDPFLSRDSLRSLVILNSLQEAYMSEDFPQEKVLEMIHEYGNQSDMEFVSMIANNLENRLRRMDPGQPAPDFEVTTISGETRTLSDYTGEYLYITFFSPECSACLEEMNIMPTLHERYGTQFRFLSLAVEPDEALTKFANKHPNYYWDIASIRNSEELLRNFEITQFPAYVLIDKEGNILQAPAYAPSPSGNYTSIDRTFFELSKTD